MLNFVWFVFKIFRSIVRVGITILSSFVIPLGSMLVFATRNREFIFNRELGTLTVKYNKGKKRVIIKHFKDIDFARGWHEVGNNQEKTFCLIIANVEKRGVLIRNKNAIEWFSLFVWYMDKNRPLPPGTAFDLYREQDYDRRKKEGFPEPLYPLGIETPEWVGAEGGEKLEKYRGYVAILKKNRKRTTVIW